MNSAPLFGQGDIPAPQPHELDQHDSIPLWRTAAPSCSAAQLPARIICTGRDGYPFYVCGQDEGFTLSRYASSCYLTLPKLERALKFAASTTLPVQIVSYSPTANE